jgi:diketogulonate reductase-like aldo/keto reductase
MEKLLATGKVKAIGVANYSVKYLEQLLKEATVVPAVNQIENHPSLPQQEIVDFCKEKGIHVTAYSPLGSTGSPMFQAAPIVEVAKKRGVTPASVLLSYHSRCRFSLQMDVVNFALQLLEGAQFSPNLSIPTGSRLIWTLLTSTLKT